MATTRPTQQVSTFESKGDYYISFATESSNNTFYLNKHDAIELLLSLTDTLQGNERKGYIERLRAISLYEKTLTNA